MSPNSDISSKARLYASSLPRELLSPKGKNIISEDYEDDILPFDLYRGCWGNIEKIIDQINKSYYFGIYDGCLILMRKLIEMLLINTYKEFKIEREIKDSNGLYLELSDIVNNAIHNGTLDLTRNSQENLGPFRERGNFSAHNPFFSATKKDIDQYQYKYRQVVEELMRKAKVIR
jgi:hypothetical protein